MGVACRVRGCAARIVHSKKNVDFLYCRRYACEPRCEWQAVLVEVGAGRWELRQLEGVDHNAETVSLLGSQGFLSLEQRQACESALTATSVVRPRSVFRSICLDDKEEVKPTLVQIQNLKKNSFGGLPAHREVLGDLQASTAKFANPPRDPHQGYFCVREITRGADGKPFVVLVATTKELQKRFTSSRLAAADGGFKHAVQGWPLTTFGAINDAQNLGECGLMLTSDLKEATMVKAFQGYRASSQNLLPAANHTKLYSMSDAAA